MSNGDNTEAQSPRLTQAQLDLDIKTRSNPLFWRGQFSPQLVEAHLAAYTSARSQVVLDPFAGSGIVVGEAARLGHTALGVDVNPAALTLASAYCFATLSHRQRQRLLKSLELRLNSLGLSAQGSSSSCKASSLNQGLLALWREESTPAVRSLLEILLVAVDVGAGPLQRRKVWDVWNQLRSLTMELPLSKAPVQVALADARALPLPSGVVDFVFTSPPYINVFNYHQQYRASLEALGWDVLSLATSEIGANRKHRGNRLLTVVQYCLDMTLMLQELTRVCRPGARAILVVGRESRVRKTPFYNGRLLQRIACEALRLKIILQQERVFRNRFGASIREDLLHLEMRPRAEAAPLSKAAELAVLELKSARKRAPKESLADLASAIEAAPKVPPSPFLQRSDRIRFAPGLLVRKASNGESPST